MPAAPNCCSKSSLRARRKPRSPAPPMPPSPNGAPPSPTPGSPLPSSTDSPSTLTSSRPARGRTGSTPPTKPGTEPINSAVNTGQRQPNQHAGWGQVKTAQWGQMGLSFSGPGDDAARDRATTGQGAVDDLAGAAPQRRHPEREVGLSGLDRAMEGRVDGPPPGTGQARHQRSAAQLCPNTAGR